MALTTKPHCISNQSPEYIVKHVSIQPIGQEQLLSLPTTLPMAAAITKIYEHYYGHKCQYTGYDFSAIYKEIKRLIKNRNLSDKERLDLYCRLLHISNEKRDKEGAVKYLYKAQAIEYHPYREFCIIVSEYVGEERIAHLMRFLSTVITLDDFTRAKINENIATTFVGLKEHTDALYYCAVSLGYGGLIDKYVSHFTMIDIVNYIDNSDKTTDIYGLTYYETVCIDTIKKCLEHDHRIAALVLMETHFLNGIAPNTRFWQKIHREFNIRSFLPELHNYKFHFPLAHATHLYTFSNLFSHLLYKTKLPKYPVYMRKEAQFYYLPFDNFS